MSRNKMECRSGPGRSRAGVRAVTYASGSRAIRGLLSRAGRYLSDELGGGFVHHIPEGESCCRELLPDASNQADGLAHGWVR